MTPSKQVFMSNQDPAVGKEQGTFFLPMQVAYHKADLLVKIASTAAQKALQLNTKIIQVDQPDLGAFLFVIKRETTLGQFDH